MVHKIVCSIIIVTEELEYIPTWQILMNHINCAFDKCTMKVILKVGIWVLKAENRILKLKL